MNRPRAISMHPGITIQYCTAVDDGGSMCPLVWLR